jgi:hypothetical protein
MDQQRQGQLPPQLPPQVLRELKGELRRRSSQAPSLPPRDVEVDQPLPADEQQVPAPPQSSGLGWKGYTALYASAMATCGLFGVGLVATGHVVKKVYDLATAPEVPEVTV